MQGLGASIWNGILITFGGTFIAGILVGAILYNLHIQNPKNNPHKLEYFVEQFEMEDVPDVGTAKLSNANVACDDTKEMLNSIRNEGFISDVVGYATDVKERSFLVSYWKKRDEEQKLQMLVTMTEMVKGRPDPVGRTCIVAMSEESEKTMTDSNTDDLAGTIPL